MKDGTPHSQRRRKSYRAPQGLPLQGDGRGGAVASVLLHALLLLLFLLPGFTGAGEPPLSVGAGGEGPAGGGGGGRLGSGGSAGAAEGLRWVQVAPEPPPPAEPEETQPSVERTEPVEPELPLPEPRLAEIATAAAPVAADIAALPGFGGGSGNDGSAGDGPGSGGGIGSGVGTGHGSAVGPGTGGGSDQIHPPMPVQFFLPPLPAPNRIKPYRMVAIFDIDEDGSVISFEFNESSDRNYNRRLREVLAELRFRPAVTRDGRPVRARAIVSYEL